MRIHAGTFGELINEFYTVKKRVLQSRALSRNSDKLNEHITLLIENYNIIFEYTKTKTNSLSEYCKDIIFSKIENCRILLLKLFKKYIVIEISENLILVIHLNNNIGVESEIEINMATIYQKKSYNTMCALQCTV